MATIDQQFVEYIVKTLVNNPDKVSIDRKIDEKGVLLSLTVDPRYNLKIVNGEGERVATISSDEAENDYEHTEPTEARTAADLEDTDSRTSELAEKTRADLADIDDLEI